MNNGNYTCLLPGMQSDHIVSTFPVVYFPVEQRKNYILCVSVMSQVFSIRLLTEGIKFLEVKVS